MTSLVPKEKLKLTEEDSRHMSKGMEMVLKRHGFDVKLDMVRSPLQFTLLIV